MKEAFKRLSDLRAIYCNIRYKLLIKLIFEFYFQHELNQISQHLLVCEEKTTA